MKQFVLIFFFLFSSGNTARGHEDDVDSDQPIPVFDNFADFISYGINHSYPFKKLHSRCVLAACPQLTTVCPYNCDGNLNPKELETLGKILTSCLRKKKVICGLDMGQLPIVPMVYTTATLIHPALANGTCAILPGTGHIMYLDKARLDFPPDQNTENGPIHLQINVSFFKYQAVYTCDFNITSLGLPFLKPVTTVTFPAVVGQANYSVDSALTLHPHSHRAKIQEMDSKVTAGCWNFTGDGLSLPQCMVDMLNTGRTDFYNVSAADRLAVLFLSTYITSGLRAADRHCDRKYN